MKNQNILKLSKAKQGRTFKIVAIKDEEFKQQSSRLGLDEGSIIKCVANFWGGPVVILKNQQEIALGKNISNMIEVQAV